MRNRSRTSWKAACRVRRATGTTRQLRRREAPRPRNQPLRSSARRDSTRSLSGSSACVPLRPGMHWQCRHRSIDLTRPVVMGILNVTPDSFSDGGLYADADAAVERAAQMVAEGAAIIDVGGESTRPGAAGVDAAVEIERVVPVIARIAAAHQVAISIDSSKPRVMAAAVAAGACIVNDVRALRAPGAREWAAQAGVGVCLMHMQGAPSTMQERPEYHDAVGEVCAFLLRERAACLSAGIARESIAFDPGLGFGKGHEHNLAL